jgi:hypothetical protein
MGTPKDVGWSRGVERLRIDLSAVKRKPERLARDGRGCAGRVSESEDGATNVAPSSSSRASFSNSATHGLSNNMRVML